MGGWGRSWAEELLKHPDICDTVGYVDTVPDMLQHLQRDVWTTTTLGVHLAGRFSKTVRSDGCLPCGPADARLRDTAVEISAAARRATRTSSTTAPVMRSMSSSVRVSDCGPVNGVKNAPSNRR